MAETWILFLAEPNQPGWEERKLPMGGLTDILDEQWDYTGSNLPQVGDRFRQFLKIESFADPEYPESSTHVREGDWVITRVEQYAASSNVTQRQIVLCYCKYEPVITELRPLGRAKPKVEQTTQG
ncbi:MAG: hypothetical protein SFY66_08160 [Oculatellaceae cyanobacterium bins.114]|nr:hypothetical protein [Oculatellaceae cyanobacterium bins.114]